MTTTVATAADPRPAVGLIRAGGRFKADIKKVCLGAAQAILKDFAGKSWPVRLFGRAQVAREMRALARLRDVPGVPACYGRWGRYGVLIERVDGDRITRWCALHPEGRSAMFQGLDRLVEQIHARGVVHLDLRKRDNILIGADGLPSIIDFNASCCFDSDAGPAARLVFSILRRIDASAVGKWKLKLAPALLRPVEALGHRCVTLLRFLWIFN